MEEKIVANLKQLEEKRIHAQLEIDSRKSPQDRNRMGQYATPNELAVDIASFVKTQLSPKFTGLRFADPAIGTGSFFSAALKTFGPTKLRSAIGVEIDDAFASLARNLWGANGLQVVHGDFTKLISNGTLNVTPNLILANPPYVRHHHLESAEKLRLKKLAAELVQIKVSGLAGLYVYFLLLATAWMEADGIAAWLIPSEFMDVNYGAALREFLITRNELIRVHRFDPDDVQFDDALVSSAVVVFRKRIPSQSHTVCLSFGGTMIQPVVTQNVSMTELSSSKKWTSFPFHVANNRQANAHGDGQQLSDLFQIRRGIATGCNKFFILSRTEVKRWDISPSVLIPVLPSPRKLKTLVVDSDSDGYPIVDEQLCLINCTAPENRLDSEFPTLAKYFATADSQNIKSGYLIRTRTPWYRQEQRLPAPFLCTYMGRSSTEKSPFRFILNHSQAVATNLYLLLYPKPLLSKMLIKHPQRTADVHRLLQSVTGNELRGEGRVYGGGLNKIEPRELGNVSAKPFFTLWPELREAQIRQLKIF